MDSPGRGLSDYFASPADHSAHSMRMAEEYNRGWISSQLSPDGLQVFPPGRGLSVTVAKTRQLTKPLVLFGFTRRHGSRAALTT
jgi:hypothetical protein